MYLFSFSCYEGTFLKPDNVLSAETREEWWSKGALMQKLSTEKNSMDMPHFQISSNASLSSYFACDETCIRDWVSRAGFGPGSWGVFLCISCQSWARIRFSLQLCLQPPLEVFKARPRPAQRRYLQSHPSPPSSSQPVVSRGTSSSQLPEERETPSFECHIPTSRKFSLRIYRAEWECCISAFQRTPIEESQLICAR